MAGGIWPRCAGRRGVRWEVECGSKPAEAGVRRALRFCVMESSIVPRERRRKSGEGEGRVLDSGLVVAKGRA